MRIHGELTLKEMYVSASICDFYGYKLFYGILKLRIFTKEIFGLLHTHIRLRNIRKEGEVEYFLRD